MKKLGLKIAIPVIATSLAVAFLVNVNQKHVYKYGEYVPEEDAYFVETIDDPAGLVKAHKFVTPTDNKYSSQKTRSLGSGLIGDIESVWSSYTGKGTTIAVIDDGFDYDHPEFTRQDGTSAILSTSRYYYASGNTAYYKSYSSDPTCIAEDWESDGDGGYEWATHGTATSTTAAAPMNNGGGVGIAPEADILALKIDFSFVAIKAAIQYAISQNVDVINMSLGAYAENFTDGWGDAQEGDSSTATYLNNVCQQAYNAGIIVVAAAGNESTWHKSYPACNTKVIGVGALGDWDNKGNANKLAEFTNYVGSSQTGEINVDILAPGYVYTAEQTVSSSSHTSSSSKPSTHSHTYSDTQGTSFSCPIIAGAACLWKQKNPTGTPDQFLTQLQSSADGIGTYASKMIEVSGWYSELTDVGPSNITNGRLNVANLLDINEPYVSTIQSSLNISVGEKKQIDLDTYNGTISYNSADTSVATVSSSGLVEGKAAGDTTITVTASKNGHTATATVSVNVAPIISCTSLTFSPKTVTLSVGDTYNSEPTITVTPSNASRVFLFESEDESVATVDMDTGLVTAVGVGSTTINAVAGYGSGDDSLTVTVEAAAVSTWKRVESTSGIDSGDKFVFASYSAGKVAGGLSSSYLEAVDATFSSSTEITTLPADTSVFTLGKSNSNYTFTLESSGEMLGYNAKNLAFGSGTTTWTMSISSGIASITGGSYILAYNTSSPRWKTYDSNFAGGDYSLFKKTTSSSGPTPTVSGVTISPSSLSLDLYNNTNSTLSATVTGTNSPAQTVTWLSSNTSIATVDSSGKVTAKAVGNATITATSTVDTNKSGTCTVTVTDSTPKTLSSISISGQKTSFTVDDTFSFGGTVTAHFSDSSSSNVTSSATFSGYNMSVAGNYTITVSYTYGGTTKTTTYQITVSASGGSQQSNYAITFKTGSGDGTSMSTSTSEANYLASGGEYISSIESVSSTYYAGSNGLKLGASSSAGSLTLNIESSYQTQVSTIVVNTKLYNSSKAATLNVNGVGAQSVSSSFSELTFNVNSNLTSLSLNSSKYIWVSDITINTVDLSDKIVSSLSAIYSGGSVYVGNNLDTSKVSVTASYTDSVKYPNEVLSSLNYSLTGFSSLTSGEKTVTVTYTGALDTLTSPMTTTFAVNVIDDSVTNVTVTNTNTYHPGQTITKSDITVTLSWASGKAATTTTDFAFADDGYQFTYADAPSGGSNGSKQFSITYAGQTYNFSVTVNRVAYETISGSTTNISSSQFNSSNLSKDSGTASPTSVTIGGVAFTVTTNAYAYYVSSTYYLSFGKTAGSIQNTNAFATELTSISIAQKSGARQDGVLYISKDGSNWVSYSSTELAKGGYKYFKFAYESTSTASGGSAYSNIQTINFTLAGQDNASNVANYIMIADTENQCTSKLNSAVEKLNTMSNSDKNTFWTSNDYVIATARERLLAWAAHEDKTLSYTSNTFVLSSQTVNMMNGITTNNGAVIAVALALTGISALSLAYFFIRKKKEQ